MWGIHRWKTRTCVFLFSDIDHGLQHTVWLNSNYSNVLCTFCMQNLAHVPKRDSQRRCTLTTQSVLVPFIDTSGQELCRASYVYLYPVTVGRESSVPKTNRKMEQLSRSHCSLAQSPGPRPSVLYYSIAQYGAEGIHVQRGEHNKASFPSRSTSGSLQIIRIVPFFAVPAHLLCKELRGSDETRLELLCTVCTVHNIPIHARRGRDLIMP